MKKIALVGTASSSAKAPFHDPSWELWGVSGRADHVTRATRWFELHRLDGEPEDWATHWRASLKKMMADVPELIMMYPEPNLHKNVVQYPREQIIDRFGTFFMTSTFSWMMALAIEELRPRDGKPVKGEIGIWGVDMEYGTEYRQQRAGFRHFISLAQYAGIPVHVLADGGLAYDPVPYPFWQDDPLLAKNLLRRQTSLDELQTWEETRKQTDTMLAGTRSALAEIKQFKTGHYKLEEREAYLSSQLVSLEKTLMALKEDIACKRGQYEEQCWLDDFLRP